MTLDGTRESTYWLHKDSGEKKRRDLCLHLYASLFCSCLRWTERLYRLLTPCVYPRVLLSWWMQSMASSTWVFYNRTGLSRHGASQPAGAGGCSRKFPELPVALPQSKPLGVSAPLRRLSQAQPYTKDRVELQGRLYSARLGCGTFLPLHIHLWRIYPKRSCLVRIWSLFTIVVYNSSPRDPSSCRATQGLKLRTTELQASWWHKM